MPNLPNMAKQVMGPFVILTYGQVKLGKTTDLGYSFPRALFVAAPGALDSIQSTCGYTPDRTEVATIMEATSLIKKVGKEGKYETVVLDDFSFLAEQTFSMLEKKFSGFKLWGELRDAALEFRNESRYAKTNVVMNSWEQPAKVNKDGAHMRGGPQLAGKLPESIPALCDVVLRAVPEPARQPWPVVYRCAVDPSWIMGDRLNIAGICDPAPMNLGELVRASGRYVARHKDLPNQEKEVEAISTMFTGVVKHDAVKINEVYRALVQSGQPPEVVRWTIRDAVDRSVIRAARLAASFYYIDTSRSFLG
jgi:hypothetical protein